MTELDYHLIEEGLTGQAGECGDAGLIRFQGDDCVLSLVDGLGHGKVAFEAADQARTFLGNAHAKDPVRIIKGLHTCLKGTRGAVAAVCRIHVPTGEMHYSGMGNIDLRIFGPRPRRLVTRDGILGYMIPTPRQEDTRLLPGDILVMNSDGLKAHFDPLDYPGLFLGTAREICTRMVQALGKETDDRSCIVARYG